MQTQVTHETTTALTLLREENAELRIRLERLANTTPGSGPDQETAEGPAQAQVQKLRQSPHDRHASACLKMSTRYTDPRCCCVLYRLLCPGQKAAFLQAELSRMIHELELAKRTMSAAVENASEVSAKLEDSERDRKKLQAAVGQLKETTAK